jgi:hypothetical protein
MSGRRRDGRWESGPAGAREKEYAMRSLVRFLLMVCLSMGVWMAIGLGVGYLLHWFSPFAPSDFNCLNFKLPVESNSQAQPL